MSIKTDAVAALRTVLPCYAVIAPASPPVPYIRYIVVSGGDEPNYDGDGSGATHARLQVDIFAKDYATASTKALAARAALYAGVQVGEITDNPDDYEIDTGLYRVSFDANVWE